MGTADARVRHHDLEEALMIEGIKLTRVDLIAALCFALGVIIGIFSAVGILVPKYYEVLELCVEMIR